MSIPHATTGEVIDASPLGSQLASQHTHAVFKSEHLEVIRLVLQTGKTFPPHKVAGEVTIHCIEGKIEVSTDATTAVVLHPHQLLMLAAGQVHGVVALEPSSALVTIALRK